MSKQRKTTTAEAIPIRPTKPASPPSVTPEQGWDLHSPYGALMDTERRPLERLEAIHAFLMRRDGLTSRDAAARAFGPFLSDANSEIGMRIGADKLRRYLMVCDMSDRAYSLFPTGVYADRTSMERLAEQLPYVPHHHFDSGTPEALLYALAQMAGEVWALHSGDFDLNDRLRESFADGYFPSLAKAKEMLGPIAVRHDLAHRLWGWGRVVADQVEAAPADPMAKDVGTLGKKTRHDWKGNQTLYCKLQSDFDAAEGATVKARREAVAAEWGISPAMVKKALQEGKKPASAAKQKKASPLPW